MNIEFYGRFYTSTPLVIGELEKHCIENLKQQIINTSKFERNLIVNCTWINVDETDFVQWFRNHHIFGKTKVYFTAFIDGLEWFVNSKHVQFIRKFNCPVEFIGFHPDNWYSFLPALLKNYTDEEIKLENIKNLYISLNRKPRSHRQKLVELLIQNNLIDRGHVTFERGHFEIIDKKTGDTEQHLHNEDIRFSRPEDIQTLGNLEIWKSTYCVIVSETDEYDPWHISEKTWKPIMGMRPFILNSNKNTYKILANLNLYTPAALFKNSNLDKADPVSVTEQIKSLYNKTDSELLELYNKQYDMLIHNKNIFLELCKGSSITEGCGEVAKNYGAHGRP